MTWSEQKELMLCVDVPTRIDFLYLVGGGKLRTVMMGTFVAYHDSAWGSPSGIPDLKPQMYLTIHADDAQRVVVSYRENRETGNALVGRLKLDKPCPLCGLIVLDVDLHRCPLP